MKKLIVLLIVFVSFQAQAYTFDWERISRQYVNYDIGFFDGTLMLDLKMMIRPGVDGLVYDTQWKLDQWESFIEDRWSTDMFDIPVKLNWDWVSPDEDYNGRIIIEYGWGDLGGHVYSNHWAEWMHPNTAAHEAGHWIGLYDEYPESWYLDPDTGLVNTGGVMHEPQYPALDYYYDEFFEWYGVQLSSAAVSTPIPGSVILLFSGLVLLIGIRRAKR